MERAWRTRHWTALVVASVAAIGCTSEPSSAPQSDPPSTVTPSTASEADDIVPATAPPTTAELPHATTPPATSTTSTPPARGAFTAVVPDHVRSGPDGLVTVVGGIETALVTAPVDVAFSDGAGGVVFRSETRFWWLASGSEIAVETEFWGRPASTADGEAVLLQSFLDDGDGCDSLDGGYQERLVFLGTETSEVVGCGVAIGDVGRGIAEHRNGRQVSSAGTAYANIAHSTGLSIADVNGASLAQPAFMGTPDWCDVCDVSARLSRDGSEVATWYRSDYAWVGGDDGSGRFNPIRDPIAWNERLDTDPADLRITDLDDGAVRYRTPAPARTGLHEFDGRFIVLVPRLDSTEPTLLIDTTGQQPPIGLDDFGFLLRPETPQGEEVDVEPVALAVGDIGPWVSYLQQQLVANGADIEIDGRFGPATEAAVVAAQQAAGLSPTGDVDDATWSALT